MRIFNDCYEMVREVEREIFEMGIRVQSESVQDKVVSNNEDYMSIELTGYDYKLSSMDKMNEMLDYLKIPKDWVEAEFKERIATEFLNPGVAWELRRDMWQEYIHDGLLAYSYNERIREQLPLLIRELKIRPNTRQGIITMYDVHKDMGNWGAKGRIPCSMYYQFFKRNEKLQGIYVMRSCDFLNHFAADVAFALKLFEHVAKEIECPMGHFTHFIGSLHAFKIDMSKRGIF